MKTITVNVSEPVYLEFQEHSRRVDRTTSELIREAMEFYRDERIHGRQSSVHELRPLDLGTLLLPFDHGDDVLGEMLSG